MVGDLAMTKLYSSCTCIRADASTFYTGGLLAVRSAPVEDVVGSDVVSEEVNCT